MAFEPTDEQLCEAVLDALSDAKRCYFCPQTIFSCSVSLIDREGRRRYVCLTCPREYMKAHHANIGTAEAVLAYIAYCEQPLLLNRRDWRDVIALARMDRGFYETYGRLLREAHF